jgi:hypothetical protein
VEADVAGAEAAELGVLGWLVLVGTADELGRREVAMADGAVTCEGDRVAVTLAVGDFVAEVDGEEAGALATGLPVTEALLAEALLADGLGAAAEEDAGAIGVGTGVTPATVNVLAVPTFSVRLPHWMQAT